MSPQAAPELKQRTAALSVASNSGLILLKVIAGPVTGSVAILTGAVLLALALVKLTGAQWLDPVVALVAASAIVLTGVRLLNRSSRVLVDQALPEGEVRAIRAAIEQFGPRGVVGYHELRTRRAGSRRYVDLHVQFRGGTSLEDAHKVAHELQDLISQRLSRADVLI